jgi:hypothetical protein
MARRLIGKYFIDKHFSKEDPIVFKIVSKEYDDRRYYIEKIVDNNDLISYTTSHPYICFLDDMPISESQALLMKVVYGR